MNIKNKYMKIIILYVIVIIIIISTTIVQFKKYNNKVVIIDDREKAISYVNSYIPVKIQFSNKKWGSSQIVDSKTIRTIWNFINSLPKSSYLESKNVLEYNDEGVIGTIYYLNGKKDDFYIGNVIKISNYIYGDINSKSEANFLRNKFNEELYTSSNVSAFINEKNKVEIIDANGNLKKLGNEDKNNLKEILLGATKIQEASILTHYIENKGKTCYHIKVYVDQESNDTVIRKENATNIINIDVYGNDYFVVTDLKNESGNQIHMIGDLKSFCNMVYSKL